MLNAKQTPTFEYKNWTFHSHKSTILDSKELEEYSNQLCLPQFPTMTFQNYLEISHQDFTIRFATLDALKSVDKSRNAPFQVSISNAWKKSRSLTNEVEVIKPFDWTFTTDYKGTVLGPKQFQNSLEEIDFEKLKQHEPILFFDENLLFEDELVK